MLFSPNPNELHAISKCEQLPYSTWCHKNSFYVRKTTHKALQALCPLSHMAYLFLTKLVQNGLPRREVVFDECQILLCSSLFCCNFLLKQLFLGPSILNSLSQQNAELHQTRKQTLPSYKNIQNAQQLLPEPSNHSRPNSQVLTTLKHAGFVYLIMP